MESSQQSSTRNFLINYQNYQQILSQIHSIQESSVIQLEFTYLQKKYKQKIIEQFAQAKFPQNISCVFLKISNSYITDKEVEFLISSNPIFKFLQVLDLTSNSLTISDDIAIILSKQPCNVQLTHFSLKNNKNISDKFLTYLSQAESFKHLQILNLDNCDISDTGLQTFTQSQNAQNIQVLIVSRNNKIQNLKSFSPDNKICENMKNLKRIELQYCIIFPSGFETLQKSGLLSQLQYLDISSSFIGEDKDLINAFSKIENDQIISLQSLVLRQLHLNVEILGYLLQKNFTQLLELDFEGNDQLFAKGDPSVLKNLQNLQKISLKSCNILPKDIQPLIAVLPQLTQINLSYNDKFGDEGLQVLEQSLCKNKINLQQIWLGGCSLSKNSLDLLAKSQIFLKLNFLYLRENNFGDEGISSFCKHCQMNQLSYLNLSACGVNSSESLKNILQWSGIKSVVDFRFSENIKELSSELVEILEKYIDNCVSIKIITLGSAYDNTNELPKKLTEKNIQIIPYLLDDFD